MVITIDGQMGSGGRDLGVNIARVLGGDYLDRWILAEAAKRIGATVEALSQKEQETGSLSERIARLLQALLERSAVAGAGGDPYFGPGIEAVLARPYEELSASPITRAQELDDQRFKEVTTEVIKDMAKVGNAVIIGRGGCVILKDEPSVLHVGVVAELDDRIARIMDRHHLEKEDAEKYTNNWDKAREAYFRKFFKVSAMDPMLYHVVINTSTMSLDYATDVIIKIAKDLEDEKLLSK